MKLIFDIHLQPNQYRDQSSKVILFGSRKNIFPINWSNNINVTISVLADEEYLIENNYSSNSDFSYGSSLMDFVKKEFMVTDVTINGVDMPIIKFNPFHKELVFYAKHGLNKVEVVLKLIN